MIAIIQFRTDQSSEHEQLCFNKYLPKETLEFYSIFDEEVDMSKPEEFLADYNKLILAGSGEFLLSRNDETEQYLQNKIAPLIDYVIKEDFPTLGVCFGSQLIGHLQGGSVGRDVSQAEAGIQRVKYTAAGKTDPLFKGVSNPINVAMGHEDSVLDLPNYAVHLAYSDKCTNQAYKIGSNVYAVQFHPEFDDNDLYERLSLYAHYDEFELGHDIPDTVHGPLILANFASMPNRAKASLK